MSKVIRVVVADDSAFIRSIICSHLESAEGFEVVGTAEDGRAAVDLVRELRPDVLTLDVDMPNMSGIDALEEIMRDTPTPIVMVSGVSLRAAETTLQAIQSGAVDFVLKYIPGVKLNPEELRLDIISKVRAAAEIHVVRTIGSRRKKTSEPAERSKTARTKPTRLRAAHSGTQTPQTGPACRTDSEAAHRDSHPIPPSLVVIGASTGGPVAIKQLLSRLPTDFDAPILVVQHIPHAFTSVFAAQLNCQLPFHAQVAEGGESLRPRHIYIAPGDRHLLLNRQARIELRDGPPISGHKPSIDVTMKSVAQYFPHTTFGVLLTGMGVDGASGMEFMRSQGGRTFAQSTATCVVDGMPKSAISLNAVDHIASPEGIADRIVLEVNRLRGERLATQRLALQNAEFATTQTNP